MAGSFPRPNDIRMYIAWSKGKSQPPDCVPPIQTIPDILHGSYLLFGAISRFIAYALLDIVVPRAPIEYQTHGPVSSIFFVKFEDFLIYFLCRFYSGLVDNIYTIYGRIDIKNHIQNHHTVQVRYISGKGNEPFLNLLVGGRTPGRERLRDFSTVSLRRGERAIGLQQQVFLWAAPIPSLEKRTDSR